MLLYLIKNSLPEITKIMRELSKDMDSATMAAYKEMWRGTKQVLDAESSKLSQRLMKRIVIFTKNVSRETYEKHVIKFLGKMTKH